MANWSDRVREADRLMRPFNRRFALGLMVVVALIVSIVAYVVSQHATGGDTRLLHAQPVWQTVEGERRCISVAGEVARQWPEEVCK